MFTEAHRALELLEDYHSRLSEPQDRALRIAIERVIRIFKSRLFQALLGKFSYGKINFYIIILYYIYKMNKNSRFKDYDYWAKI